jgi:penicillin-binding protein 1A
VDRRDPARMEKGSPNLGSPKPHARDISGPEPPRRSKGPRRIAVLAVASFWLLLGGGIAFSHWLSVMPDTANLLVYEPGRDVTILDAKGRLIARRGLRQGETIGAGELPDYAGNAFVAIEDHRFYSHAGIDFYGLARAVSVNWREGGFVQGGSTLTQQLAKNLFLNPERTLARKFDEAILALSLEARYSKQEILTLYLNRVYFGAGVYGIEAAALRYFGKHARELTLIEAAMLAGSVKAPSRYNPAADPAAAMERARLVLAEMERNGFIDERARLAALSAPPQLASRTATSGAGYFADYVMARLSAYSIHANEPLIVKTTLDLGLQSAAEEAVASGLKAEGKKFAAGQGALVALGHDGAIRALVGGRSYDESAFNRAADAKRQPGSAFKAFVYLTALERGHRPEETIVDGPVAIGDWRPGNYEGEYLGAMTLTQAFAGSSNSAAVQLTNEAGPEEVARTAQRLGVRSALAAVPSLALGASEMTPLELTGSYAAFANGGKQAAPYGIVRITAKSGHAVYTRPDEELPRVMSQSDNAAMTAMMLGAVRTGTGRAAALPDRSIAGKTGTSQGYRDAWFVGFSADYVCGVWIGNDDGAPMKKAVGGGLPARMFKKFMTEAHRDLPPRPLPGEEVFALAGDFAPENVAAPDPPRAIDPVEDRPVLPSNADLLRAFEDILARLGVR